MSRQRLSSCRCSTVAQAIDKPSNVAVPRPISSRMTSARATGLVEDRRGFDHFDHEGRPATRQVIGGADAAENNRSTTPICASAAGTKDYRSARGS
jgi:hypothetical protein